MPTQHYDETKSSQDFIGESFFEHRAATNKQVICIVLPTYNEAKNIANTLDNIFLASKNIPEAEIRALVVDDSSPDGTADIVKRYQKSNHNVHLLIRTSKDGLGAAYIYGMKKALELIEPNFIVEMDSDGQHDPQALASMLTAANNGADFVIGSRFVEGGSVAGSWSATQRLKSTCARLITRYTLGLQDIKDVSGGFRLIRASLLSKLNLDNLGVQGYAFQAALLEEAVHHNAIIQEVPITFGDREEGESKMSSKDILEGFSLCYNVRKKRFVQKVAERKIHEKNIFSRAWTYVLALITLLPFLNKFVKSDAQVEEFARFGIIGLIGTIINTGILWTLTAEINMNYLIAAVIATETAIITNFIGNDIFTFKNNSSKSVGTRFALFQAISITTIIGTVGILWALTSLFGEAYLLIWNLIAIITMFIMNFVLNKRHTWTDESAQQSSQKKSYTKSTRTFIIFVIAAVLLTLVSGMALAEHAAVSQMGYHPDSAKQVVVYTSDASGTFIVRSGATQVYSGDLVKAKDGAGNTVECQGNVPCLVGEFSEFDTPGTYTVVTTTSSTHTSPSFIISESVYEDNVGILLSFFDAMKQQNSPFHADMNTYHNIPAIADGSFLLTADQAAITTIRLGAAYRRNPDMFSSQIANRMIEYTDYLMWLQGAQVEASNSPNAFRVNEHVEAVSAFVPGPTSMSEVDVYTPGSPPAYLKTVPVTSLCGSLTGSAYDDCVNYAQEYYKCEENEVCLNMTHQETRGVITHNGLQTARGWIYEFGCFQDIDLSQEMYINSPNPCLIFDEDTENDHYTALTFTALLQAYPAALDFSSGDAAAMLSRAQATQVHLQGASLSSQDEEWYGAGLFLLYDYTGNSDYLIEAHALRGSVSTSFDSFISHGNEYYWEEYIRHKDAILNEGLPYEISGKDPREYFEGKMYFDWENNDPIDISQSSERVFQKYRGTTFQNSRAMIIEAIMASRTLDMHENTQPFVSIIADNQLAWLTGMNGIQAGTGISAPIESQSFIFGIGDQPNEYHSRYLIDTGYSEGGLVGARGSNLQFLDGGEYYYFDGKTTILGEQFGSLGNNWGDAEKTDPWVRTKTYQNGHDFIPGWINGAFDTNSDADVIFNYDDDLDTYEYTESTNEMVAAGVELLAYQDAIKNNKLPHELVARTLSTNGTNSSGNTTNNTGNNTGNSTSEPMLIVEVSPSDAYIYVNGTLEGQASGGELAFALDEGSYLITAISMGYGTESIIAAMSDENTTVSIDLDLNMTSATLIAHTTPDQVMGSLNGGTLGESSAGLLITTIPIGTSTFTFTKDGYDNATEQEMVLPSDIVEFNITLDETEPEDNSSNTTNETALSITDSYTNITGDYFEVDSALFKINTSEVTTIRWYVDGVLKKTDSAKVNSTFTYTPGIMYTSNTRSMNVTVKAEGASYSWDVTVLYAANPFWTSNTVRVFTNDAYMQRLGMQFTDANVSIKHDAGTTTHALSGVQSANEIDWKNTITLQEGHNYIVNLQVADNSTGETYTFTFPAIDDTDNYVQPSGGSGGGGGGGGGGAASRSSISGSGEAASYLGEDDNDEYGLRVVNVLIAQNVLPSDTDQDITVDARGRGGAQVDKVTMVIETPLGTKSYDLRLTEGDNTYGTWSMSVASPSDGEYVIKRVILFDGLGNETNENVNNRKYYVGDAAGNFNFHIVASLLSESEVDNGSTVLFETDLRDTNGIVSAIAIITTRDETFELDLERTSGDEYYGTWSGEFMVDKADTTYRVTSLVLNDGAGNEQTVQLPERAVYVRSVVNTRGSDNLITGNAIGISDLIERPLIPTVLAFAIMAIIILLANFVAWPARNKE